MVEEPEIYDVNTMIAVSYFYNISYFLLGLSFVFGMFKYKDFYYKYVLKNKSRNGNLLNVYTLS